MWTDFLQALQTQLDKQVVAGAVALGLVGVLAASLRKLPALLWSQAQRRLMVQATLDSRTELFVALVDGLAHAAKATVALTTSAVQRSRYAGSRGQTAHGRVPAAAGMWRRRDVPTLAASMGNGPWPSRHAAGAFA